MRVLTVAAAAFLAGAVSFGALTTADMQTASAQSVFDFTGETAAGDPARLAQWDSVCSDGQPVKGIQAAGLDLLRQGQCHLRFVDIFNASKSGDNHQALGLIAAFVTPEKSGVRVEFGIAPGLIFEAGQFHLSRNGFPVWKLNTSDCLSQGVCTFTGPAAEALVAAFSDPSADTLEMRLDFIDQSGKRHQRQWQMMPFSEAFADFAARQNPPIM